MAIAGSGCPQSCSNFLNVSEKAVPKSTLSQHFKVLREAGLNSRGSGGMIEMHNTSRCAGGGWAISGVDQGDCERAPGGIVEGEAEGEDGEGARGDGEREMGGINFGLWRGLV